MKTATMKMMRAFEIGARTGSSTLRAIVRGSEAGCWTSTGIGLGADVAAAPAGVAGAAAGAAGAIWLPSRFDSSVMRPSVIPRTVFTFSSTVEAYWGTSAARPGDLQSDQATQRPDGAEADDHGHQHRQHMRNVDPAEQFDDRSQHEGEQDRQRDRDQDFARQKQRRHHHDPGGERQQAVQPGHLGRKHLDGLPGRRFDGFAHDGAPVRCGINRLIFVWVPAGWDKQGYVRTGRVAGALTPLNPRTVPPRGACRS